MNYYTAWFIGPLGRLISHHKRTASEFVFNRAETNMFRESWTDYFGANLSTIFLKEQRKKMCQNMLFFVMQI